jgi:hypothetical protein
MIKNPEWAGAARRGSRICCLKAQFIRAIRGERFFLPPGLRDRFYRQTRISAFERKASIPGDELLECVSLASGQVTVLF